MPTLIPFRMLSGKASLSQVEGLEGLLNSLDPILTNVKMKTHRSRILDGEEPLDGQLLSRSSNQEAWALILSGAVPVCSDAEWLSDKTKRGFYSTGDGSTTFRMPDYNGKQQDSLAAVYVRGDGKNSAGVCGTIQGDVIREITGALNNVSGRDSSTQTGITAEGAFEKLGEVATIFRAGADTTISGYKVGFKASRSVPTGPENRPVSVTGCWAVRVRPLVRGVVT